MPAFAFAYGSFADILATTQLVIKVVGLLRSGSRSVECAETEEELKSLSTDLANLKSMPVDDALQSSPMALSVAARVQKCWTQGDVGPKQDKQHLTLRMPLLWNPRKRRYRLGERLRGRWTKRKTNI
ncbi:hypothetical protein K438DRAFT_1982210 [Mycena galopus ATCC 62051]|nr:hypothetical protein K438DRAFT_1982210 [Mycena galopus ATCC 62051]